MKGKFKLCTNDIASVVDSILLIQTVYLSYEFHLCTRIPLHTRLFPGTANNCDRLAVFP